MLRVPSRGEGDRYDPRRSSNTAIIAPAKPFDARQLVDIEFHAFASEHANQVLSYRDRRQPAHRLRAETAYEATLRSVADRHQDTGDGVSFVLKATDATTREIVSFAKFEVKTYSGAELRSPPDVGHEGETRMNRDWFALNERMRRQYVGGERHCYIAMLATQPRWQHHGAGTMLLEHILAHADRLGVPVYLEATDTARPLYRKHGFEPVAELRFDPAEYGVGGLGVERQTVMVRGALWGRQRRPIAPWSGVSRGGPGDVVDVVVD